MIDYEPLLVDYPKVITEYSICPSAWGFIANILIDITTLFCEDNKIALDLGVADGYSTSALSNYFDKVIGVDIDISLAKKYLKDYSNIELIETSYQEFIKTDDRYDLIHIDLIHKYEDTFEAGEWAVRHSDCVLFHDTISFPEVMRACEDLADKYNLEFLNYRGDCGLGILYKSNERTSGNSRI